MAHAIAEADIPSLPKGDLRSQPARLQSVSKVYMQRWSFIWKAFKDAAWKGSHRILETPSFFREYVSKSHTYHKMIHVCLDCQNPVERSQLPVQLCSAFNGSRPTSTVKKRRDWAKWSRDARQQSSGGRS